MECCIVYPVLVQVKLFPSENVTAHYGVKSGLVEMSTPQTIQPGANKN